MTKVVAKDIGERIFIDISSVDQKAYDGARYWVLVVDDKTNKSWSFFVGHKDQQVDPLFELLLLLHKNKTPVKYIRADNAGENMLLQEAIRNHRFLNAKFEFTPRNSPEYNGRCERKFAFLWSCLRSILNAAKLPDYTQEGTLDFGSPICGVGQQLPCNQTQERRWLFVQPVSQEGMGSIP